MTLGRRNRTPIQGHVHCTAGDSKQVKLENHICTGNNRLHQSKHIGRNYVGTLILQENNIYMSDPSNSQDVPFHADWSSPLHSALPPALSYTHTHKGACVRTHTQTHTHFQTAEAQFFEC